MKRTTAQETIVDVVAIAIEEGVIAWPTIEAALVEKLRAKYGTTRAAAMLECSPRKVNYVIARMRPERGK